MKKTLISLAVALFAFFTIAYADSDITVIIDGEEFLTDAAPFIEDGVTLVPMRGIFEMLGASVDWDGDTKTVTAENRDTKIVLGIGSKIMKKDNDDVELIRAAVISNDRTFVPLRAVSEAFGADVEWNGDTKTVTITTVKETPAPTVETAASPEPMETPEPTPQIPTPQPVTSISNKLFGFGASIYPSNRGAFVFGVIGKEDGADSFDEYGIRISENQFKLYSDEAIKLVPFDEDVSIDEHERVVYFLNLDKSGITLKPDTKYYYGAYAVRDGIESKGEKGSFKTLKEKETYPALQAETKDIQQDDVTFVGKHKDKAYVNPRSERYGIYFGVSEDNLSKIGESESIFEDENNFELWTDSFYGGGVPGVPYNERMVHLEDRYYETTAKKLGLKLAPGTTYFWKFYTIWDNEEYTSDVASFTTDIE